MGLENWQRLVVIRSVLVNITRARFRVNLIKIYWNTFRWFVDEQKKYFNKNIEIAFYLFLQELLIESEHNIGHTRKQKRHNKICEKWKTVCKQYLMRVSHFVWHIWFAQHNVSRLSKYTLPKCNRLDLSNHWCQTTKNSYDRNVCWLQYNIYDLIQFFYVC